MWTFTCLLCSYEPAPCNSQKEMQDVMNKHARALHPETRKTRSVGEPTKAANDIVVQHPPHTSRHAETREKPKRVTTQELIDILRAN